MAPNTQNGSLRNLLEKDKLSGTNFLDWHRNLKIVLRQEKKMYVLELPILTEPKGDDVTVGDLRAHRKFLADSNDVTCLMLSSMTSELQKQNENMEAYEMNMHLLELFSEQIRHERYELSKALYMCHLAEGEPVVLHVMKMIDCLENLDRLGSPMDQELATNLVLHSLLDSYNYFVLNYNVTEMNRTLPELLNMLRKAEQSITKGKGKT